MTRAAGCQPASTSAEARPPVAFQALTPSRPRTPAIARFTMISTTGYWVAHVALIIVNLVIAGVLGRLGLKAWKATGRRGPAEVDAG